MTTADTTAKPAVKTPARAAAKAPAKAKPAAAAAVVAEAPAVESVVAAVAVEAPTPEPVLVAVPAPAPESVLAVMPAPALKSYEDAAVVAKDALEAVVASSELLSKGLQDLGNTVYALAQQSLDEGVAASKQMLVAKSLREVIDLHSSLARSQFDRLLDEAPRLSERSVKLLEEALAPISAQVNAVVDQFVHSA